MVTVLLSSAWRQAHYLRFMRRIRMYLYVEVFKKALDFEGRATRKEYWCFYLINMLIYIILNLLDIMLGVYSFEAGVGILSLIFIIVVLIPGLAVTFRRLHDIGRSGWWFLVNLIPLIGPIIFLIFMLLDSQEGENRYGLSPKAIAA